MAAECPVFGPARLTVQHRDGTGPDIICRSYGAGGNLYADCYKDLAPTEHGKTPGPHVVHPSRLTPLCSISTLAAVDADSTKSVL
jgi:hypothetical protein